MVKGIWGEAKEGWRKKWCGGWQLSNLSQIWFWAGSGGAVEKQKKNGSYGNKPHWKERSVYPGYTQTKVSCAPAAILVPTKRSFKINWEKFAGAC